MEIPVTQSSPSNNVSITSTFGRVSTVSYIRESLYVSMCQCVNVSILEGWQVVTDNCLIYPGKCLNVCHSGRITAVSGKSKSLVLLPSPYLDMHGGNNQFVRIRKCNFLLENPVLIIWHHSYTIVTGQPYRAGDFELLVLCDLLGNSFDSKAIIWVFWTGSYLES